MGEETDKLAGVLRMLRGLMPMAGALRSYARDEAGAEDEDIDLREVSAELARHLVMIIDLVTLESGTVSPRYKQVELGSVVRRWFQAAQAVHSELELSLALPNDSVFVKVEPRRLDQILEALLNLHGARASQARVAVRAHQGQAFVEVVTPRPYFSTDVLERSAAPFATRGLSDPRDEVAALSLGRASRWASAMEGRLTVTSDDEVFRVHLSLTLA